MTKQEKQQIIQKAVGNFLQPGKVYPATLPPDLADWYCYTTDGGHSILSLLEKVTDFNSGRLHRYSLPVSVKTVLRVGHRIHRNYPVVDLPYSYQIGLITEIDDDEF